jgi:hypothetical protein
MIMTRLLVCLFMAVGCTLLMTPASSFAQTTTKTSEQSLQELVTEVRQLRSMLQRMNATLYKGQVMLERFKLQQEQVVRIERELRDTRDNVSELRGEEIKIKELLRRVDSGVEAGTSNEKERASLNAEFRALNQRQHQAMMRESQLAHQLQIERAKLNELNDKLNLIEREL